MWKDCEIEDGMGCAGLVPSAAELAQERALKAAYNRGIYSALAAIQSFKPGGDRPHKLGHLDPEIANEIRAEERGEQIAKEELAKKIQKLIEHIP